MKKKENMDGEKQQNLFSTDKLEPHGFHSKRAIETRMAFIVDIIRLGQMDYDRLLPEIEVWKKGAEVKNYDYFLKDGMFVRVFEAKYIVQFMRNWRGRRASLEFEYSALAGELAEMEK